MVRNESFTVSWVSNLQNFALYIKIALEVNTIFNVRETSEFRM